MTRLSQGDNIGCAGYLHTFDGTDGSNPHASLIQATDGNFYGTAYAGGDSDNGTVFRITPAGALTTLHSFDGADGAFPVANLVEATDGNFYGTTYFGGNCGSPGCGTVFKITPSGTLTVLYVFCSQPNCSDGSLPASPLLQASDGNFYGTTQLAGTSALALSLRLPRLAH